MVGTAFFSAAETALTSVSHSNWDRLRRDHLALSSAYTLWSRDPSLVLGALLFGNTLMSLGASIIGAASLEFLAVYWPGSPGVFFWLSALAVGGVVLIGGEIFPKLYARRYQDRVLRHTALPIMALTRFLEPVIVSLTALTDVLKKMISSRAPEPLITPEELRQVLADTHGEGLAPTARRMLSNLMAFDQVKVEEVMIPRAHIIAIALEQNTERMFTAIVRSGFSRLPVYFGNIDNILGIVYAKDLLAEWRSSGLLVLEDLLRPPFRIAPDAPLPVLLQAFRQGHHLAVVADAQGRTQGLVTIEDAVEAIVGEIADEFDQPT